MRIQEEGESVKLGIMQPYFLPYIGYWQLLNAVDQYVIYDDVNFINRGWINRNRILINGKPAYFNLPVLGASQNKLIREIKVNPDKKLMNKNLKTIELAYKKAPYFPEVFLEVKRIMENEEESLSRFILNSIKIICSYLEIHTELLVSSSLKKNNALKGQDKILEICALLGATEYYNAVGGQELYSYGKFAERGIHLCFLKTGCIEYAQFNNEFQQNLSILDVMMFNSVSTIKEMLGKYTLITGER